MTDEAGIGVLPNRWASATFEVNLVCEEFTCICPVVSYEC